MKRHVGLLGLGQSIEEAPFGDPSVEFWGIANGHSVFPNWAIRRWIELHERWIYRKRDPTFVPWAQRCDEYGGSLYLPYEDEDIPRARLFPKDAILQSGGKPYFTSTLAWMLGMCWLERETIRKVSLWGINLSSAEEYRRQRPCAEYWIGRLEGAGVEIGLAEGSLLTKDGTLYAYMERTPYFDLVNRYEVGGTENIEINGVSVRGVWIDPHPSIPRIEERV